MMIMNKKNRKINYFLLSPPPFSLCLVLVLITSASLSVTTAIAAGEHTFGSTWGDYEGQRDWIGKEYWANRLQDWEIRNARLECRQRVANKPMRTVHLLTRRISREKGSIEMKVRCGLIDKISKTEGVASNTAVGFLFAAGVKLDYRAAALIHHSPGPSGGYFAGVNGAGEVFIRDFDEAYSFEMKAALGAATAPDRSTPVHRKIVDDLDLKLRATPGNTGAIYNVTLEAFNAKTGALIGKVEKTVGAEKMLGSLALVSHPGGRQSSERFWFRDWDTKRKAFEAWAHATARYWFKNWYVGGSKVKPRDGAFGPVVCTQYTIHNGTLGLTAQLTPLGKNDPKKVRLQIRRGGVWTTISETEPNPMGWTAVFRIPNFNAGKDTSYRIVAEADLEAAYPANGGTIRKDPVNQRRIKVAAFTGNMMVRGGYEYPLPYGVDPPYPIELEGKPVTHSTTFQWNDRVYFPHNEVVANVRRQKPDLLFFSGDQVYEGNPTRAQENPLDQAHLDYLYKWFLWCWTWRDLTRDIPCICIPDDHDVYQRNIWGDGGEFSPEGDLDGSYGGYFMHPDWINMIQRTQTSHLPPPYDRQPAKNGIDVYFTSLNWGGIGFAVIEDRKFKSFPSIVKAQMSRDSHITQKVYDITEADVENAVLLGERQLRFLHEFAGNWRGQEMKAVLSQTIFANLQILNPRKDGVPQDFSIPLDRDLDSNGWPQRGRRKALLEMRRGFMVHIAGDQHLASTIHHGTDEWEDACFSLCVPSVANYYARSWNPKYPPDDGKPGKEPFSGRYFDGFKNRLTVANVANPNHDARGGDYPEPIEMHREMPGYGIVIFDKTDRTISLACWSRVADPVSGRPYKGWPIIVKQTDNYARAAGAWLPTIEVKGLDNPVIQIIDDSNSEIVYTLRIRGKSYRPRVFRAGRYTVRIGEPDTNTFQTFKGVNATPVNRKKMVVEFLR
jgi:hypothetical protein